MRRILIVAAVTGCALGASIVLAEKRQINSSVEPPAISMSKAKSKTLAAPVPGRNSFTKNEAVKRLASHGYSNVSSLVRDSNGIWRGIAVRDGRQLDIALDYQGNIVDQ